MRVLGLALVITAAVGGPERPVPLPTGRPIPVATPFVAPSALPSAESGASVAAPAEAPVAIRVGTTAVMVLRERVGGIPIADRAAVVQGRVTQVLLHHPHLVAATITVVKRPEGTVIMWGPFPIITVDEAHAKANRVSSPEVLAHLWANQLRQAVRTFVAAKRMPARVLHRLPDGSAYAYRRSNRLESDPSALRNTRVVFSPADFDWGPGVKDAGQEGFVIFVRQNAPEPPQEVFLGNPEGRFTAYDRIRPEESP